MLVAYPFIKLGKHIFALFRDKFSTNVRATYQTFEVISYFNRKNFLLFSFLHECYIAGLGKLRPARAFCAARQHL